LTIPPERSTIQPQKDNIYEENVMKYRIKQVGNKYYPQYKLLFVFWCHFKSSMYGIGYCNTVFWSLEDAKEYLDEIKSYEKLDESVSIHNYSGE
jgi:hypothetical protein